MSIQAIDQASVHRLTSGQVVIDLQTAVKELLENALDAGATSVEVRFKEYGVDAIEVQDNGRGIEQSDWPGIALKHHTSKLSTYADLDLVSTLGFRGEALSSLCGTASLSIVTATADTAPAATSLSFAPSGECIVGGKVARSKGTTVSVKELFKALPVRRKDLVKNSKREFGKAVELVQGYALVKTGCRIEVKNIVKGKSTTHLQTQSSTNVRGNFSSLFTPKALLPMMDLDLVLDVTADKSVLKWSEGIVPSSTQVRVKGLISKPTTGNGRTSGNRQFYYVNGRPFSPTKVAKAINDVYKTFNTGSFPCVVADFQLPSDAYDVNVSPDKRTIFLHSEGNLITALTAALEELFQPSRSTYTMSQIGAVKPKAVTATPGPSRKRASSPTPAAEEGVEEEEEEEDGPGEEEDGGVQDSPPRKRRKASLVAGDDALGRGGAGSEGKSEGEGADKAEAESGHMDVDPAVIPIPRPEDGDDDPTPANDIEIARPRPRSPSPPSPSPPPSRSRSPSSLVPQQPKLRQVTLDTTVASWARTPAPKADPLPVANSKGKEKAGVGLKAAAKSLRQFFHPSQIPAIDVDGDEEDEEEGMEEADDELGEGMEVMKDGGEGECGGEGAEDGVPAAEGSDEEEDGDDDIVVVEDGFKTSQAKGSACPCSHSTDTIEASDDDDDDEQAAEVEPDEELEAGFARLEEERLEHLAALDAALGAVPLAATPTTAHAEVLGTQIAADTTVAFNMAALVSQWTASPRAAVLPSWATQAERDPLAGASIDQDDEQAEEVLSRVVSKKDFAAMSVVGQFNLGFIIARRTVAPPDGGEAGALRQDDLFIVDQHASDEKYNFELLQQDTVIQSQRLLQPRSLNLPSHEEIIALENVDILKMNGFEVLVDEDAPVGQRVKLIAQPVSKDTVWGVEDLEELLDLIGSSAAGEVVRPSKTRKMFASRACRKSVMIGKALTKNQMTSVVRHMGGMDQPWACPHGRPTMRWLAGLGTHVLDKRADISTVLQEYI